MSKVPVCSQCGKALSTQDQAAYGNRCEECWVGNRLPTARCKPSANRTRKGRIPPEK